MGVWAAEHDMWDEAIFRWKKALEENPDAAILHNNLAVAYEKKGLWEETGRLTLQGSSQELMGNEHIRKAYLGM